MTRDDFMQLARRVHAAHEAALQRGVRRQIDARLSEKGQSPLSNDDEVFRITRWEQLDDADRRLWLDVAEALVLGTVLTDEQIEEILAAAIRCGLVGPKRRTLFTGLPGGWVASLPSAANAEDQLRFDLREMQRTFSLLGSKHPPLVEWLKNAEEMVFDEDAAAAQVFAEMAGIIVKRRHGIEAAVGRWRTR